MCIIVAKEKNKKLPDIDTLKTCFEYNKDGAGFMYVYDNTVVIDKGYMTWKSFKKRYEKLKRKFNNFNNKALVMHFRIGTSSTNSPENTHPYPISNKESDLHKTYFRCKLGMAHNGIITAYNPTGTTSTTNDTQNFVMNYVYKLYKYYPKFYKDRDLRLGMEKLTNSKLCFMDTNDDLYYVGDFIEENGVKYSNDTYKPFVYPSYYEDFYYDWYSKKHEEYLPSYYSVIMSDGVELPVGDMKLTCENGLLYEHLSDGTKSLIDTDTVVINDFGYVVNY